MGWYLGGMVEEDIAFILTGLRNGSMCLREFFFVKFKFTKFSSCLRIPKGAG